MGFELIDHTADIGIKVKEDTMEEAFATSAKAMFGMISESIIEPRKEKVIRCSADDPEQLLVDFLSEILYIYDVKQFMVRDVKVNIKHNNEWRLVSSLEGERYDADRHDIITEVKAVTYHMLSVKDGNITVLFDL